MTQTYPLHLRGIRTSPSRLAALATLGEIKPAPGMVLVACGECKTEFYVYLSMRPGKTLYCSPACRHAGHGKAMRGKRWSDRLSSTKDFRKWVKEQQGRAVPCLICGWDEDTTDVCHIVARKDGGKDELGNIVRLCPNHHRMFDAGKIPQNEIVRRKEGRPF